MASKVAMCNAALIKIGANEITSLTEDSEEARKCNARFDDILDMLLESHLWNFATKRATLAASSTSPTWGYNYKYLMPQRPYCLRVDRVYNNEEYKIEGRYIHTDATSLSIRYIYRVTDMNELGSMFRECFSLYLAAELAYPLAGSSALKQELLNEFTVAMRQARSKESMEETADQFQHGSWYKDRGRMTKRYVVARRYDT